MAVATREVTALGQAATVPARPAPLGGTAPQTRPPVQGSTSARPASLASLYQAATPGVVSILVQVNQGPITAAAAGSGFIFNEQGYIVTNSHVVGSAEQILVVFHDGIEAEAELIGTDDDSDLAVIKVDELPADAHTLPVGNSDAVQAGDWVVAIGNPFAQQSSMTAGVVSAVGRTISSLTDFDIPQAIQTDASINPGNSGGPLLNLDGEVIGVNEQIALGDSGVRANAGVGFAVPSNIVAMVIPALIEDGVYRWPWLGVSGPATGVNLAIQQANNLETQRGAYIDMVFPDSPASDASLQGSTGARQINGATVPVGGDVVIAAGGKPVLDFSDLLITVAFKKPGDTLNLTVLRNGEERQVTATLAERPASIAP
jgi:S1-C subfamily serine protease